MTAERRTKWILAGLIGAGVAVSLVLGYIATDDEYDRFSYLITGDALRDSGLSVYDSDRWPYPPGFFPWLLLATSSAVEDALSFDLVLRLPMILANAAIALLVWSYLGRRGASTNTRLLAAGLMTLGPVALMVSGYHGQIDSLAILPAVAAFWVWDRDGPNRGIQAGLLIGLGAMFKTVPIFLLVALLPWARSTRERVLLVGAAVAVPILALAPFLLANGSDTIETLRSNQGFPGFNGLSFLLLYERFGELWSTLGVNTVDISQRLTDVQNLLVAAAVFAIGVLLWRRRPEPAAGASLMWLVVLAINPNFAWQYLVWGIPYFLMAGFVRETAILELLAAIPLVLFFVPMDFRGDDIIYAVLALAVWAFLVMAAFVGTKRVIRAGA